MVRNVQPVIRTFSCWIVLSLMVLPGISGHGFEAPRFGMLPTELSDIGYIRVVQKGVFVPVQNINDVHGIGDRLPLVQKNQRYYIALREYEDGYIELSAYPRVNFSGEGTAWVTQQKDLIFGADSESSFGRMFLRPSEVLPITAVGDDHYVVTCERYERAFSLRVPKLTVGVEYQQSLPDHVVQMVEQRNRLEKQLARVKPNPVGDVGIGDATYSDLQTSTISTEKIEAAIAAVSRQALEVHPAILQATHASGTITDSSPFASGSAGVTPGPSVTWPDQISPVIALTSDPAPELAAGAASEPTPSTALSAPAQDVVASAPVAVMDSDSVVTPDEVAFGVDERVAPASLGAAEYAVASGVDGEATLPMSADAETGTAELDEDPAEGVETIAAGIALPDTGAETDVDLIELTVAGADPTTGPGESVAVAADLALIETPPLETDPGSEAVMAEAIDADAPAPAVTAAILKLLGFLCALAVGFIVIVFGLAKVINRKSGANAADPIVSDPPPIAAAPTVPEPVPALAPDEPPADMLPESDKAGAETPDVVAEFEKDKSGTFTGSLHGFDISELIQFLNASKETGTLSITENDSPNQSKVMFSAGEIVNALCAGATGDDALSMILSFHDGFFVFKRQLQSTTERTINQSTMSLLMNLHQSRDEGAVSTGS